MLPPLTMTAPKHVLDLNLLAPDILRHGAALADALAEVEAIANDTNFDTVVGALLSKPGLLEFILSGKCSNITPPCVILIQSSLAGLRASVIPLFVESLPNACRCICFLDSTVPAASVLGLSFCSSSFIPARNC